MADPISVHEAALAATGNPTDSTTLLNLIGRIGTEDAAVPYSKTGESEQEIAMNIIKGLFLPLKAIAECSSIETEADYESGSDDDSSSEGGSHGDSPRGFRGPRVSHPAPAALKDDPVKTYIFPPSPLLDLDDDEYKNDTGTADLGCTSRVARYLDDCMGSGTVSLLQKTAHDAGTNTISTLPRTWADRFRRFHSTIEPRHAYSILARDDSIEGQDERCQLVNLFLKSDENDFLVRSYTDGGGMESIKQVVPADPLLRQLLFLHARITWMLYRSRAGALIDRLLTDNSKTESLSSDGGTMADVFMQLRLEGWYKKPARGRGKNTGSGAGSPGIWIDNTQLVEEEAH